MREVWLALEDFLGDGSSPWWFWSAVLSGILVALLAILVTGHFTGRYL